MELKKEKEDLALEVEREEELLTNTLQKKLNQVSIDIRIIVRSRLVDHGAERTFPPLCTIKKYLVSCWNSRDSRREGRQEELLTNSSQNKKKPNRVRTKLGWL